MLLAIVSVACGTNSMGGAEDMYAKCAENRGKVFTRPSPAGGETLCKFDDGSECHLAQFANDQCRKGQYPTNKEDAAYDNAPRQVVYPTAASGSSSVSPPRTDPKLNEAQVTEIAIAECAQRTTSRYAYARRTSTSPAAMSFKYAFTGELLEAIRMDFVSAGGPALWDELWWVRLSGDWRYQDGPADWEARSCDVLIGDKSAQVHGIGFGGAVPLAGAKRATATPGGP